MTRKRGQSAPTDTRTMTRDPGRCPHDGAILDTSGVCHLGGGYGYLAYREVLLDDNKTDVRLLARPCPFACPICREFLEWDGRCEKCHGCTSGSRDDWTFPGDRYDLFDDEGKPLPDGTKAGGQHWIKTGGPRKAVSASANAENLRLLQRVLANAPLLEKPKRGRRGGAA